MAKAKKGTKENPITQEDLAALAKPNKRPYRILQAIVKDDLCSYHYEMTEGKGPYDVHKVDGKGLVKEDLTNVFRKFRVHLAAVYGAFKLQGIDVQDIDQHHNDDITHEFHVTGFKMRGSEDMESIILIGSKSIQELGGRMELETPKIDITSLSGYKWYNELKTLADQAREEVALYKEGKYTVIETEEDDEDDNGKKKRKAKKLNIMSSEAAVDEPEMEDVVDDIDDDFNDAQV